MIHNWPDLYTSSYTGNVLEYGKQSSVISYSARLWNTEYTKWMRSKGSNDGLKQSRRERNLPQEYIISKLLFNPVLGKAIRQATTYNGGGTILSIGVINIWIMQRMHLSDKTKGWKKHAEN